MLKTIEVKGCKEKACNSNYYDYPFFSVTSLRSNEISQKSRTAKEYYDNDKKAFYEEEKRRLALGELPTTPGFSKDYIRNASQIIAKLLNDEQVGAI